MRTLNVALLGQKFMGRAHSNAWGQVGRFFDLPLKPALHTVCGRDAKALAAFSARWGWRYSTTDWRTLLCDSELGLVDVSTPNDVHMEPSIAFLEAGVPVACEKPLAGTLKDARAMKAAAAKSKAKSFVWFNYRRCPAIATAWQLVRDGRLGKIFHVRATYLQSWGGPSTPLVWRFQKGAAGSGAHGDLNAHIVDLARFLTGDEIVEVNGAIAKTFVKERVIPGTARKGRSDVDDAVLFLATFRRGAIASFEATRLATGHLNRNTIELNGEHGALRFDFEDMNVLWFHDATVERKTRGWTRIVCTGAGTHPYAAAWWPEAHVLGYEHGFVNMAADVVRAVAGKRPEVPLPDFADAYETQRVLEAALVSARERSAIPMSQIK